MNDPATATTAAALALAMVGYKWIWAAVRTVGKIIFMVAMIGIISVGVYLYTHGEQAPTGLAPILDRPSQTPQTPGWTTPQTP